MRYFQDGLGNTFGYDATQRDLIAAAIRSGWTEVTGNWPLPPVAPPPSHIIAPIDFIARFTTEEQTSIASAAMSNVALWLWFNKMTAALFIDLTNADVITAVGQLVSAGLLTTARQTVILTP